MATAIPSCLHAPSDTPQWGFHAPRDSAILRLHSQFRRTLTLQTDTILLVVIAFALLGILSRLRIIESGVQELLRMQGFGQGSTAPSEEIKALAATGKKIEAMRLYRRQCGVDARQARKVIGDIAAAASAPVSPDRSN